MNNAPNILRCRNVMGLMEPHKASTILVFAAAISVLSDATVASESSSLGRFL